MKELVLGATVSFVEENTWIQMRNTGFPLKAAGAWLVFQWNNDPSSTEEEATCPYFQIILNILTINYRKIHS